MSDTLKAASDKAAKARTELKRAESAYEQRMALRDLLEAEWRQVYACE
jgi:hypothetical protein